MSEPTHTTFSERVAKIAESVGGRAELARRTGLTVQAISNYVSGASEPSRPRLIALAKAAGVSVQWLAEGEGVGASEQEPFKPKCQEHPRLQNATGATIADRLSLVIGTMPVNAFATKVGVSQPLLRKYLAGSIPGADKLAMIAKAANVSLRWLATGEGRPEPWSAEAAVSHLVPIEDVPRESFKAWFDEWWAKASARERTWILVELERHFPEYSDWKKKTEQRSSGQCGA